MLACPVTYEVPREVRFAFGRCPLTGHRKVWFPVWIMAARQGRYLIPMRRYLYSH